MDDTSIDCPQCNGPAYAMGTLGNLLWLRCRNCGWEFNHTTEKEDEDGTETP